MQCPICDKDFEEKNMFLQHMEDHKKKSILSRPPESILQNYTTSKTTIFDTKSFFDEEYFESLIQNKVKNIENVDDLVLRRTFAEQVKKIIASNPFTYLPYMIDDFFIGKDSQHICKKYHIRNQMRFKTIIQNMLKLEGKRYREKQYKNAFEMNLKIPRWEDKYNILKDNLEFFKHELLELIFRNVLRSFILVIVTDFIDTGISKHDIITKARSLPDSYDIFRFVDKPLQKSFDMFFNADFDILSEKILDELIASRILKRNKANSELLSNNLSIDNLKGSIIKKIQNNGGSQYEYSLRSEIEEEYPSLKLIPSLSFWEASLSELMCDKIIRPSTGRSKMLYLERDYGRIQQNLHQFNSRNLQFYGRNISPEDFIEELLHLEKGDFEDEDDQITRIAGLMLAEFVKLQPPRELIPEFDFATDITGLKSGSASLLEFQHAKTRLQSYTLIQFPI